MQSWVASNPLSRSSTYLTPSALTPSASWWRQGRHFAYYFVRVVSFAYSLVGVVSFAYYFVRVVSFAYSLVKVISFAYYLVRVVSFAYSLVGVVSFAYSFVSFVGLKISLSTNIYLIEIN